MERIPYPVDQAVAFLKDVRNLILVGEKAPVGFFAYPDKPGTLYQPGTRIHELTRAEHDPVYEGVISLDELRPHLLDEIEHFFDVYKMLEPGKDTETRGYEGAEAARAEIAACRARYTRT